MTAPTPPEAPPSPSASASAAPPSVAELAARVVAGDVRAAARLMRDLDDRRPEAIAVLKALFAHTGRAYIVGVTGNPGSGKSTVVDALISHYRAAGERVGVVAVDPTSPFSGGAILGDRIRMQRHARRADRRGLGSGARGEGHRHAAADVHHQDEAVRVAPPRGRRRRRGRGRRGRHGWARAARRCGRERRRRQAGWRGWRGRVTRTLRTRRRRPPMSNMAHLCAWPAQKCAAYVSPRRGDVSNWQS